MNNMMRGVRLDEVGSPDKLKVIDMAPPKLAKDGVLIRVEYAGIIYADAEARRGTYYRKTPIPWFPGREAAGIVAAVGADVVDFKPGDRVAALVHGGGCYAEYVQARTAPDGPPSDIVHLPPRVSFSQALVYLVNFRLAHLVMHAWARTPAGARILVHGAAGGMGAMLLQLAKKNACEVVAIVRSPMEAAFCTDLGAAHAIDATICDYVDSVRALGGADFSYSFNGVGGDTINSDPFLLAPFGELHCYGYVAGKPPLDLFGLPRTVAIKTFNADDFLRTPHFKAATAAMHEWFAHETLLDAGRIFPLTDVAAAHGALEAGDFTGKIVLQP